MAVSVSKSDWDSLNDEDRAKIQEIIGQHFQGETVSPDANVSAKLLNNPACESACGIAEGAAVSACQAVPFPGNVVCVAAARAAGDFCRSRC